MAPDFAFIKTRVGDDLGLSADDLVQLFGVQPNTLDTHLKTLGKDNKTIFERVLADIDAVRIGYRLITVTDEQIDAIRRLLSDYLFHPLITQAMADGSVGWRLSGDDSQFVAYRAADVVNMDFDWSDVLRTRLNRLVIWPDSAAPTIDQKFRDRVVDVTLYLIELTGIV